MWSIRDEDVELEEEKKKRMQSIYVALGTIFIDGVMFSVTMPSMALYMDQLEGWDLDSSGDDAHLLYGVAVSAYSLGQVIGGPIVGYWSNISGPKIPLIFLLLLFSVMSLWYAMARNGWEIIVSRFIIGFADGNMTICRAFIAHATKTEEKEKYVPLSGAAQAVGFTLGFFVGSLSSLVSLFPDNDNFGINQYTSPGYISFLVGLVNLALVIFFFLPIKEEEGKGKEGEGSLVYESINDGDRTENGKKSISVTGNEDEERGKERKGEESVPLIGEDTQALKKSQKIGIVFLHCDVVYYSVLFSLFETVLTPFLNDNYGFQPFLIGLIGSTAGVTVILQAVALPFFTSRFGEKNLLLCGFVLSSLSLLLLAYPWSENVPSLWYFMIFMNLFFCGYGVTQLVDLLIYTKILGDTPQGTYMGYLTSTGSVARILGPIWAINLYNINPNGAPLFLSVSGACALGAITT
eukprot:CAMPEP_0201479810 /NCGR_PEP_ID=MMETSP0151_2-20130828/4460_1 /ASSEMBLY_ACC=CAM_ASM_000257 /TAXON_ID=200890 /ORGANISM="Paramoeba atlantica, Strain 621/1 / CCAP 1560/9" /LENGTH=463 /DNA_ID=CAMNT_0047861485 /DNA_START=140 /DNA_END=1529 /DNA_ORIENTATION=-